jgi:hypothetical protein
MESSTQTPGGPAYPVQFSVEHPDRELNRLATAFRLIVAIPILILASTVGNEGTSAAGEQVHADSSTSCSACSVGQTESSGTPSLWSLTNTRHSASTPRSARKDSLTATRC